MARFYIPPAEWDPERLQLVGAEAHHCADVLRLKEGELVTAFNGLGVEARAQIESSKRNCVGLKVLEVQASAEPGCRITLAQAIPKGKNMEWIVEKATELGAAGVVPLLTSRTVVQVDQKEALRKQEKWQRVAIEAAKQCGQNWLPAVACPQTLEAFFAGSPGYDLKLVGSLENDARGLKAVLAGRSAFQRVLVLVGPEGDFSPGEMQLIKAQGVEPITLGTIILRTETAAMYCLSVLSHELVNA